MRALVFAATSVAALLTAGGTVWSADLPRPYATRHAAFGVRTGAIVVYDYEPGVSVRAYWIAPWRNRRYFPTTGEMPEIGRDEDLADRGDMPQPAEAFERSWSTSRAFAPERPRVRIIDDEERLPPLPDPAKPGK